MNWLRWQNELPSSLQLLARDMSKDQQVTVEKFAAERSHKASEVAYDFNKSTAQACMLINGGAATAVLAFLAKDAIDPTILKSAPYCLVGYALGVVSSAMMMFAMMKHASHWNYFWYYGSYHVLEEYARESERRASWWSAVIHACFASAMLFFVTASFVLAGGLLMMSPTAPHSSSTAASSQQPQSASSPPSSGRK
jgi:hypothetical protein